jgi:hypothetical protein
MSHGNKISYCQLDTHGNSISKRVSVGICDLTDHVLNYIIEFVGAKDANNLQLVNKSFQVVINAFIENYILKLKNFNDISFLQLPTYIPVSFLNQKFNSDFSEIITNCFRNDNDIFLEFLFTYFPKKICKILLSRSRIRNGNRL